MHNAKIIRIDENFFRGRTKERKLFDRKISNNVTTINNPTILRIEDDVYFKNNPLLSILIWARKI